MRNISVISTANVARRNLTKKKGQKLNFYHMQNLTFAIIYISMLSCLCWSNYNFLIMLFMHFIWVNRRDSLAIYINKSINFSCFVYDILFIFMEMRAWFPTNDILWLHIKALHDFGIICFCIIFLLKIILFYFQIRCSNITTQNN